MPTELQADNECTPRTGYTAEGDVGMEGWLYICEKCGKGCSDEHSSLVEGLRQCVDCTAKKEHQIFHPEDVCQKCGGPNVVWFAPSDLWNNYAGEYDILCPICFVKAAESAGFVPPSWLLQPEQV